MKLPFMELLTPFDLTLSVSARTAPAPSIASSFANSAWASPTRHLQSIWVEIGVEYEHDPSETRNVTDKRQPTTIR